jgi:hypothetical protein
VPSVFKDPKLCADVRDVNIFVAQIEDLDAPLLFGLTVFRHVARLKAPFPAPREPLIVGYLTFRRGGTHYDTYHPRLFKSEVRACFCVGFIISSYIHNDRGGERQPSAVE